MKILPERASETTTISVVDVHELGEFIMMRTSGEIIMLKTFTTVVDARPYGMQFCIKKATDQIVPSVPSTGTWVVNLSSGWNIVGVNTLYSLQSTNCDKDKVSKTVYSYNPAKNDYDTCELSNDLSTNQCPGFEIVKATWVYNFGNKCQLYSKLSLPPDYNISLERGWNMLAVQPQWEVKKVSDIIPERCGFIVGWAYDSVEGWLLIDQDTYLTNAPASRVGRGFWASVDNSCTLLSG